MAFQHSFRAELPDSVEYHNNHNLYTIVRSHERTEIFIFPPHDVKCSDLKLKKDKKLKCVKDEEIRLTVEDWLKLAGIDLDGFNTGVEDTKANIAGVLSSTKKPYNRLTGVGIDITVRYYNLGKYTRRPSGRYYAFVDVRGRMGWFLGPATIYYRDFPEVPLRKPNASSPRAAFAIDENNVVRKSYGVKFFFEAEGGSIGVFHWGKL